jgi:hypothetical protein
LRLFRPVGLEELRLIYKADMRAFPPRLPDQPIFYPVTNEAYAKQIATDWNTRSGTRGGFVTRFEVNDEYVNRFERRVVGAREHEELWVPADELAEFNEQISTAIDVVAASFGEGYGGQLPDAFGLPGKDARAQFVALFRTWSYNSFDVSCEVSTNLAAVFLNFYFWEQTDFAADGIDASARNEFLSKLRTLWQKRAASPVLGLVA